MALPDGFSSWEHLQDVLRIYHNKLVREEFSDITDDDALTIPRGALKLACLLDDQDTCDMTLLRLHLFFFHARKASDLQTPIYGIPIEDFDAKVTYHPHVTLYFEEDPDQVAFNKQPIRSQVSYRIMHETAATMTESKARAIATKIKAEFSTGGGYRWRRGHMLVTYVDEPKGYRLKIYAFSESEARELVTKVLQLDGHTLDTDFLTIHESRRTKSDSNHERFKKRSAIS
jgi:hypothetical protein